jgi:hypothetical protein
LLRFSAKSSTTTRFSLKIRAFQDQPETGTSIASLFVSGEM